MWCEFKECLQTTELYDLETTKSTPVNIGFSPDKRQCYVWYNSLNYEILEYLKFNIWVNNPHFPSRKFRITNVYGMGRPITNPLVKEIKIAKRSNRYCRICGERSMTEDIYGYLTYLCGSSSSMIVGKTPCQGDYFHKFLQESIWDGV